MTVIRVVVQLKCDGPDLVGPAADHPCPDRHTWSGEAPVVRAREAMREAGWTTPHRGAPDARSTFDRCPRCTARADAVEQIARCLDVPPEIVHGNTANHYATWNEGAP